MDHNEPQNDEMPPPPPSWLELRQRAMSDATSAMTTFQGLLADEIVLPQSAMDANDPMAAVRATIDYGVALENAALLIPGEYAIEALTGRWAIHYIEETRAGGHVNYVLASGWDDLKVRAAMAGLRSLCADPYLALLQEMKQIIDDPKRGKRYLSGEGANDPAMRELDRRFAEIDQAEPIAPRFKMWLKSLRKVKYVADNEVPGHMQRIAAHNPLYTRRRGEAQRVRETRERSDPAYATARALCQMAGLAFLGLVGAAPAALRAHWPEGPDANATALSVSTDQGVRTALVYAERGLFKKPTAVLIAPGQALPLGSVTLSRQDFEAFGS